jgi:F-type H+-transporting ATPase subunit delta
VSLAAIGERYARALFELADESGQLEAITREMGSLAETYAGSADLRAVLDNPLVEPEQRAAVLEAVAKRLGVNQLGLNAVRLLAQRRRLGALPDVARSMVRLADEKMGVVRAQVSSATPLSESFCARLVALLEERTHKRVLLDLTVDPALLAGVITRIGDHIIDGTLDGRLQALERRLLEA